jgi:predicted nucleic acid-binding protein
MFAYSANALRIGMEEASLGKFSLWDGVLLASAAEAGCTVILSEDMQDGARLGPITICNPFGPDGLSAGAREALGL